MGTETVSILPSPSVGIDASATHKGLLLARLYDAQYTNFAGAISRAPAATQSISSITIYYKRAHAGNLYLRFGITVLHVNGAADPTTSAGSYAAYAGGGTDGKTVSITVPSAVFSSTTVYPNDVVGVYIERDASNALDTYETDFDIDRIDIAFTISTTVAATATFSPYGSSTYIQLIDDAKFDIHDARTSELKDNALMVWILEAQRELCVKCEIRERFVVAFTEDEDEYPIQDRPRVTGVANSTPIIISATAHALSSGDRVTIRNVQGTTAANGRFQLTTATTDTFTIKKFADISTAVAGTAIVTITTKYKHPFSTNDTVTISAVLGMTDLNASHVVTVVDETSFTVPITTTQAYTSGGLCLANTVGNGTWTSGGRFWKDGEIPTFFRPSAQDILQRTSNSYKPTVEILEMTNLVSQIERDAYCSRAYTSQNSPAFAAEWIDSGRRFLKVHPAAAVDEDVELYGRIQINPRSYYGDLVTDAIVLPTRFDAAILHYLRYKIYGWIKEPQQSLNENLMFQQTIAELNRANVRHVKMEVTYL